MGGWALRGLSCCKHCKESPHSANTFAQRNTYPVPYPSTQDTAHSSLFPKPFFDQYCNT